MGLTIDQQKGIDHLVHFMNDDSRTWTVVGGAAGTGKTYMMDEFLGSLSVAKVVSAPTHKAVRVIQNATNVHGETIHALNGLKPNFNINNFKVGNMKFDAMGEQKMGNYKVIVIDECSQIPKGLHELIVTRASRLGVKIIYVGDQYQLPPIKENYVSQTFNTDYKVELRKVMRQSEGNKLLQLLGELRIDIDKRSSRINDALVRLAKNNMIEMEQGIQSLTFRAKNDIINTHFNNVNTIRTTRYTAWQRSTITDTNIEIRNNLFPDAEGILVEGDVLTGYKTLLDQFLTTTLVNSDDYIVNKVVYRTDAQGIDCCMVDLENMDTHVKYKVNIVNHESETYNRIFIPIIKALYLRATTCKREHKRKNWIKYYEFKDSHLTMNDIALYNDNNDKIDSIQKEIDYGYALTTHKLQGTTVNDIIVNLKDFQSNNQNSIFRNNLIYTALSRAKNRAYTIY